MERRTNVEAAAAVTKDMSEATDDKTASAGAAALQVPFRPRSSSYSGRFPFFDFSMIPDKDPHFNNEGSGQEMRPGQQQQRVRRASSTASTSSSTASTVNVSVPDGSSVVAAALTMAASSPPPPPVQPSSTQGHQAVVESSKPVKTPQNAPRFTFFDYSLIPDKDPRAFVKTRERKDN